MSNALIRAGHGLTLAEKRIVMIALSRIDSTKPFTEGLLITTKISASEYAKEFDVDIHTAYDQINNISTVVRKKAQ